MSLPVTIRPAAPEDAEALLSIYAPYVKHTAITFEYKVPSVEEFRKRIAHTLQHYPYLVDVYKRQFQNLFEKSNTLRKNKSPERFCPPGLSSYILTCSSISSTLPGILVPAVTSFSCTPGSSGNLRASTLLHISFWISESSSSVALKNTVTKSSPEYLSTSPLDRKSVV